MEFILETLMKKRNEYHIYRYKKYASKDLQELFQVVGWLSADYPERLKKALDKRETVFMAWDGKKLVGLVNTIDDSEYIKCRRCMEWLYLIF
jgi:hypothetical protein